MPSSAGQKCALRSEEHTSELQSHDNLVCLLLLEKSRRRANVGPKRLRGASEDDHRLRVRAAPPRLPTYGRGARRYGLVDRPIPCCFFFHEAPPTGTQLLSLPDALPI